MSQYHPSLWNPKGSNEKQTKTRAQRCCSSDLAVERIQSLEASVLKLMIQHWLMNFVAHKSHLQKGSHCLEHIWENKQDHYPSPCPKVPSIQGRHSSETTKELSPGFLLWPISVNLLGVGGRQWEERRQESLMLLSVGVIRNSPQKTNIKSFFSGSREIKKSKTRRVNPR